MPDYYFAASIGGTIFIKVEAETRDEALEAAAHLTIDDWENAGPLKLGDVDLDELEIDDLERLLGGQGGDIIVADGWERSIVVTGRPDDYELAPEDPHHDDD